VSFLSIIHRTIYISLDFSNIRFNVVYVFTTRITAVGISTTWYASIYPFLTNTKLYDRAEEAMNLADAGE